MNAILQKTNVWDGVLERIEKRLNRQIFDSWFLPVRFDGLDEDTRTITLSARKVTKDWICLYYAGLIEQVLTELKFTDYVVTWNIHEEQETEIVLEAEPDYFSGMPAAQAPRPRAVPG